MSYNYSWSFSDAVKLLTKSLLFQILLWSFIKQDQTEFTLGLWFLTGDHYLLHRGHLAMSTGILTTMTQGVYWHLVYWSQNIPQCTRTPFTTKNYPVKCLQCWDWEMILKSELFPTIKVRWFSVLYLLPVNHYLFLVWLVGTGTIPNLVWETSTDFFFFTPFRWFFPILQIVSSHTCADRTLMNTWGGLSAQLWNSLCRSLFSSSIYCELQLPLSPDILRSEALLYP